MKSAVSSKEKYECTRDTDCAGNQKCSANKCVATCSLPSSCYGLTPYCLADNAHSYTCRQCLSNANCSADKKCSGYSCVAACSGISCSGGKQCLSNGAHGYSCVDCLTNDHCAAGNKCSGNGCTACAAEDKTCRCPDGQVADGKGGCQPSVPATCSVWDNNDPTSMSWNANGTKTIPTGLRCWNGYGANATINVPNDTVYENVTIRFWNGATVNGTLRTKSLAFTNNTSPNPHQIIFNDPVQVNGTITIQRGVATPVFRKGISGSYSCVFVDCPHNQYGPNTNSAPGKCPWL